MASSRKSARQHVPSRKSRDGAIETLNEILSSDPEIEALADQEIADTDEDEEDAHSEEVGRASDSGEDKLRFLRVRKSRPIKEPTTEGEARRSRGLLGPQLRSYTRRNKYELLCGPDPKDGDSLTRAADQWANDPTLPRRASFRHPFNHPEDRRDWEATKGWEWYYKCGGKAAFAQRQKLSPLSDGDALRYLPKTVHQSRDVLLGPYGRQKPFRISVNKSLDMHDAWIEVAGNESHSKDEDRPLKRRKLGWLLNVGSKVRCLDWATKEDSDVQYLALGTKQNKLTPEEAKKKAPSFDSLPGPSSVQLWSFASSHHDTSHDSAEPTRGPKLLHIWCTDWGDAKQVRWCPMPRKFQDDNPSQAHEIGLLASVWDDGSTRILDINVQRNEDEVNIHLKVDSAACTVPPLKNSICTCMCWLSATDIAVGHSNGFVAIYSIIPPSATPQSSNPPQNNHDHSRPRLILPLHQSYILSLNSCYHPFPYFLTSTTIAGTARLTDLRSPHTASISSRRSNVAPAECIYHHALFACVVPDETKETIGAMALRCWGSISATMDVVGMGGVRAMDVGKCHAALAVGCADGGVVVSNPMRRAIRHKEHCMQLLLWQHEWARRQQQQPPKTQSQSQSQGQGHGDSDASPAEEEEEPPPLGMSRITESYRARKSDIDQKPGGRKLNIEGSKTKGRGSMVSTVFEEESGVTALAWNPNVKCAGWLAVAWATGLVRVEDVAI